MSEAQRIRVRDLLTSRPSEEAPTLEQMREMYEGLGRLIPIPQTMKLEAGSIGGVTVEYGRDASTVTDHRVLYFHGGGYSIGSIGSHRGLVALLGQASRATTVSIGYRLAPENPLPAAFDDALAVYRALLESGVHHSHIAFAGDSAGGALALATLQRARELNLNMPAAVAMFSPLLDMTGVARAYIDRATCDVMITRDALIGARALFLGDIQPDDPLVSPIFADLTGFPPIYIQVGTSEVLIDDALALCRTAMIADVEIRLEAWPRQQHVFQLYASMLDEGEESLKRAGQFLASKLSQ